MRSHENVKEPSAKGSLKSVPPRESKNTDYSPYTVAALAALSKAVEQSLQRNADLLPLLPQPHIAAYNPSLEAASSSNTHETGDKQRDFSACSCGTLQRPMPHSPLSRNKSAKTGLAGVPVQREASSLVVDSSSTSELLLRTNTHSWSRRSATHATTIEQHGHRKSSASRRHSVYGTNFPAIGMPEISTEGCTSVSSSPGQVQTRNATSAVSEVGIATVRKSHRPRGGRPKKGGEDEQGSRNPAQLLHGPKRDLG